MRENEVFLGQSQSVSGVPIALQRWHLYASTLRFMGIDQLLQRPVESPIALRFTQAYPEFGLECVQRLDLCKQWRFARNQWCACTSEFLGASFFDELFEGLTCFDAQLFTQAKGRAAENKGHGVVALERFTAEHGGGLNDVGVPQFYFCLHFFDNILTLLLCCVFL
ncbi:hypothetical protein D3C85_1380330 [compost metagenome]